MKEALIPRNEGGLARLECIENRIRDNMNRFSECVIDIGRCLNQAKDEGLVPHGEWESWVQKNTGLSVRSAQRLMKAAREVPASSPLTKLSFSKVQALLALPADEREDFAKDADAENKSVRELKAAVDAKIAAERAREAEEKKRVALEAALEKMQGLLENPMTNPEVQGKIADLRKEIEGLEDELEMRADAERRAKEDLLSLQGQVARGTATNTGGGLLSVDEIRSAAGSFGGQLQALMLARGRFTSCGNRTRKEYREAIAYVADLCVQALDMLDNVLEVIDA